MQPLDYISQFPIPRAQLPPRLLELLEPIGNAPQLRVDVALRHDIDKHGLDREYVHMITALVPESDLDNLHVLSEASDGVVYYSTPDVRDKGGLANFNTSVSGFDYIVASWGDGSYYSYNLAEKVWIALGLSPRCLGGKDQRIIYDDLALPEFGVVEGEISTEYYWSSKRNVCWTMSNEYLRRYLWMRGCYGVRIFFYEALVPDNQEIRKVMAGETHILLKPDRGWYELDIREWKGGGFLSKYGLP